MTSVRYPHATVPSCPSYYKLQSPGDYDITSVMSPVASEITSVRSWVASEIISVSYLIICDITSVKGLKYQLAYTKCVQCLEMPFYAL